MFTGSLVSHADFDVTTQSLWRVGESCTSLFLLSCQVINNPGHERGSQGLHFLSSRRVELNVLNALEKFKKHEPHSARQLVQMGVETTEQVDDGVLIS